jgi:hypothetical protein
MYNQKDFKDGLLGGVLLTLSLGALVFMGAYLMQGQSPVEKKQEAWYLGPNCYGAYNEGLKTVPFMQEQDSIDNAVLDLQVKYRLTDEETENLYQALVD